MGATRILSAALAIAAAFPGQAQSRPPTAAEIAERIKQHAAVPLPDRTVDTFKAGDPQTKVKGIAVTMMATLDVLQRAAARGDNFVITHEPTFYSHRDTLDVLQKENDPVLAAKQKFIRDHGLVVWRFHDLPHAMKPDMINAGIVRALGWESYRHHGNVQIFDLPPTSLAALASTLSRKLNARAIRISGDPKALVRKVALTQGFPGFAANRHAFQLENVDAVIIGEDHEWETIEYVVDAISAGQIKGLVVLGHVPSEQAGMEEFARWLRTFVTEVPVEFIPTADPFTPIAPAIRGPAGLSFYTADQARALDRTIRSSEGIHGAVTPRWSTPVVCGFVDDTHSICWQYSPEKREFVKVGEWIT